MWIEVLDEAHPIPEFDRMAAYPGAGKIEGSFIVLCCNRIGAQDPTVCIEDKGTIAMKQMFLGLDRVVRCICQHLLTSS
ncbi:hypothetical protein DK389_26265 [Methylobacterium durans]|uniref:Uncharacterized protein n=1 Tax=Methylobacterium durans TaxID=2202825 RepID=A0A2U8WB45_9HYPH|nr:hypothetical protein DK389_26265 [Methylobacterium durans]